MQLYTYVCIFFSMQGCGSDQQQNKRNSSKENQVKITQSANLQMLSNELMRLQKTKKQNSQEIPSLFSA